MDVRDYLFSELEKYGCIHLSLIDPAKFQKYQLESLVNSGTKENVENAIKEIKKEIDVYTILFPGNPKAITSKADAILLLSIFNSRNPYYITGVQAENIESVLGLEPGMKVGVVAEADLIRNASKALGYAKLAEVYGFDFVYPEAGSGAPHPIPVKIVEIIVGGGIKTEEQAKALALAGADAIVTGTEAIRGV